MDRSPILPGSDEVHGPRCLSDPLFNKGTAYTRDERVRLNIEGLLPPRVEALDEQAARVLVNVRGKTRPLEKYLYLNALRAENETLFCRVVLDHLEEMLPIIYTPTVARRASSGARSTSGLAACIFRRYSTAGVSRSCCATGRASASALSLSRTAGVSSGSGSCANGMGIPIGKLSLYTLCAGVPPELCLPVALDVGTDNEPLRRDPLYLGERERRMTAEPWDAFLEEFLAATQAVFPGAIVQFEDFNTACAFRLLARYRDSLCCFNDDVQGTGAMGLAGLYTAGRITGRKLSGQRILFVGAGERASVLAVSWLRRCSARDGPRPRRSSAACLSTPGAS